MDQLAFDASGAAFCPNCNEQVDDVEEIGGSLICVACGGALDGPALVHQRALPRGGGAGDAPGEGFGVMVGRDDSGALAGALAAVVEDLGRG
jgi:hypothetical protein